MIFMPHQTMVGLFYTIAYSHLGENNAYPSMV